MERTDARAPGLIKDGARELAQEGPARDIRFSAAWRAERDAAALQAAARGWKVFPLKPLSKEPLPGSHGYKDATTDPALIRAFLVANPDCNIAIATGRKSGVVVLDVDKKGGGLETFRRIESEHGETGKTPLSLTPGGGRHIYFAQPENEVRSRAGLGPGIDVRGEGGYIVAPPSILPHGKYAWQAELGPDVELASVPPHLLSLLAGRTRGRGRLASSAPGTGAIPVGIRHAAMVSRAGTLRRQGKGHEEILADLLAMRERVDGDFPLSELRRIAEDAARWAVGPYNLTEYGNAERLVARHGEDLRHVNGKWYVWDGARLREDDTGEIYRRAKETVRSIYDEARAESDEAKRKALAEHARRSESAAQIKAMVKLAESDARVTRRVDELDRDPWMLTVENGTVDLRTGNLREHARSDDITKLAPVRVSQNASCPTWDSAVLAIMDGDEEMVRYLHRILGSTLTGIVRDQVLFVWWGSGGNGKSTILKTVRAILGDYAGTLRTDAIMEGSGGGGHNEDIARLRGLRLVFAVETTEGKKLNLGLVKVLTGGDAITASFKHGRVFEFQPQFKPILATNHKPQIPDQGDAAWRRLRLVPFAVRFAKDDEQHGIAAKTRRDDLDEILKSELPGIFNRLLEGCLEWQRIGLAPPIKAKEATEEYRREESPELRFLDEVCLRDSSSAIPARELLEAYSRWCAGTGETPLSDRALASRLQAAGLVQGRTARARLWRGVRFRDTMTLDDATFPKIPLMKTGEEILGEMTSSSVIRHREPDSMGGSWHE